MCIRDRLNTEYAELLAEKKAAYADYRKAREEMKELLAAKANIDRILELDKEQEEANERREKEAEQRDVYKRQDWDRRYSPDNRAWANAMSIPANPDTWGTDRNCYLAVKIGRAHV